MIARFAANRIAADALMLAILVAGVLSATRLPLRELPPFPTIEVAVNVRVPGASAAALDAGLLVELDALVRRVPGIAATTSLAEDGAAELVARLAGGADPDAVVEGLRRAIGRDLILPDRADAPRIDAVDEDELATRVYVAGDIDPVLLEREARRVGDALRRHPDIDGALVALAPAPGVRVGLDPLAARRTGLTPEALAHRLGDGLGSRDTASPSDGDGTERRLVVDDTDRTGAALVATDAYPDPDALVARVRDVRIDIPDASMPTGRLTVSDVATVRVDSDAHRAASRLDGVPARVIEIRIDPDGNLAAASAAVSETLPGLRASLAPGITLVDTDHAAPAVRARLASLLGAAWQGALPVFLVLALFLDARTAFWVAVGIPVAFAGALAAMADPVLGLGLNEVTLFGFIVALGIVVDDAIVIGESVHAEQARFAEIGAIGSGAAGPGTMLDATLRGVHRVAAPTLFGVLTTMASFGALGFVDGDLGALLGQYGLVAVACLGFSLVESRLILPAHLAGRSVRTGRAEDGRLRRRLRAVRAGLDARIRGGVAATLEALAPYPGTVVLCFVATLPFAAGLFVHGHLRAVFFPELPGRLAEARLVLEPEVTLASRDAVALHLEAAVHGAAARADVALERLAIGAPDLDAVVARASFAVDVPVSARERFVDAWRTATGRPDGAVGVTFGLGAAFEDDLRVELSGDTVAGALADAAARRARRVPTTARAGDATPVLMLTARDGVDHTVTGLEAGADDYVVKPFALREVEARVRNLAARRTGRVTRLRVEDLTLDTAAGTTTRAGTPIRLGPIARRLLETLMRASPEAATRTALVRSAWPDGAPATDNLKVQISRLRERIDPPGTAPLLHTVPNGYRLGP